MTYWNEQVLMAITNGAWLLTPAWLTASLEAGCWLPESPFVSQASKPFVPCVPYFCKWILRGFRACLPPLGIFKSLYKFLLHVWNQSGAS